MRKKYRNELIALGFGIAIGGAFGFGLGGGAGIGRDAADWLQAIGTWVAVGIASAAAFYAWQGVRQQARVTIALQERDRFEREIARADQYSLFLDRLRRGANDAAFINGLPSTLIYIGLDPTLPQTRAATLRQQISLATAFQQEAALGVVEGLILASAPPRAALQEAVRQVNSLADASLQQVATTRTQFAHFQQVVREYFQP